MISRPLPLLTLLASLSIATACSPANKTKDDAAKSEPEASAKKSKEGPSKEEKSKDGKKKGGKKKDGKKMGKGKRGELTGKGLIPVEKILGKDKATVDAVLGQPEENVSQARISCVRFVPERVFFSCEEETRVYRDPKKNIDAITVEFEDGIAAIVHLAGFLKEEGTFDEKRALELSGLALPGKARMANPTSANSYGQEDAVDPVFYNYFNDAARLKIDDREYRVSISTIEDTWKKTMVQIILNDPLSDDERARIKPVPGQ